MSFVKYLEPREDACLPDVRVTLVEGEGFEGIIHLTQVDSVINIHRDDVEQLIDILRKAVRASDWNSVET